jgi:hypothetical protein
MIHSSWDKIRRGSVFNEVFTDCQPQYPDLQGYFKADFTGLQAVFNTIRQLPDLTRHLPGYYSLIEEIVEGFVEGFLRRSTARRGGCCLHRLVFCMNITCPTRMKAH